MQCQLDCFSCPFRDCIADGNRRLPDMGKETLALYKKAVTEKSAARAGFDDIDAYVAERRRRKTETYKKWLEKHPDKVREYSIRYREKKKAAIKAATKTPQQEVV